MTFERQNCSQAGCALIPFALRPCKAAMSARFLHDLALRSAILACSILNWLFVELSGPTTANAFVIPFSSGPWIPTNVTLCRYGSAGPCADSVCTGPRCAITGLQPASSYTATVSALAGAAKKRKLATVSHSSCLLTGQPSWRTQLYSLVGRYDHAAPIAAGYSHCSKWDETQHFCDCQGDDIAGRVSNNCQVVLQLHFFGTDSAGLCLQSNCSSDAAPWHFTCKLHSDSSALEWRTSCHHNIFECILLSDSIWTTPTWHASELDGKVLSILQTSLPRKESCLIISVPLHLCSTD